jgi:hypothetical protein
MVFDPHITADKAQPPKRRSAVAFALEGRDSRPSERAPEDDALDVQKPFGGIARPCADIDISDRHPKSFTRLLSSRIAENSRGGQQQFPSRFAAIFRMHRRFFQQSLFFIQ